MQASPPHTPGAFLIIAVDVVALMKIPLYTRTLPLYRPNQHYGFRRFSCLLFFLRSSARSLALLRWPVSPLVLNLLPGINAPTPPTAKSTFAGVIGRLIRAIQNS